MVKTWQASFGKDFELQRPPRALERITGLVGDTIRKGTPPITLLGSDELEAKAKIPDLDAERKAKAERMKDQNWALVSPTLRDGTIAAHFFRRIQSSRIQGQIGASQIDMATLEMLSAQRRANVEPPALSNDEAWNLLDHIAKGKPPSSGRELSPGLPRETAADRRTRDALCLGENTLRATRERACKLKSLLKALLQNQMSEP